MRAETQALRNIGDRMPPLRNLFDRVQPEVFSEITFSHDRLLASFCKGQSVYKSRGYSIRWSVNHRFTQSCVIDIHKLHGFAEGRIDFCGYRVSAQSLTTG